MYELRGRTEKRLDAVNFSPRLRNSCALWTYPCMMAIELRAARRDNQKRTRRVYTKVNKCVFVRDLQATDLR
jgi:hypothetical protein